ncbi:MAG: hypothetical protein AAGA48_03915 [Myxococcota bacterium]
MTALLWTELRLLTRGGFWLAYAVVGAGYLAILHALPASLAKGLLPVLVFSDPAVLGLFVVGSMVLLERREGALQALAHTPTPAATWIGAKVLAITGLASIVAGVVAAGSGQLVRPDLLVLAVVPTSILTVLVGIAIVSRTSTFNRFIAWVSLITTPLALPAVELLLNAEWTWIRWLPTGGTAELLRGAFGASLSPGVVLRDVVGLVVACVGAAFWADAWTRRYLWRRA